VSKSVRIPAILALTLALTVPALALAQSTHQGHTAPGAATSPAAKIAPAVDPDKCDLLRQEYVAKTAELRGKITARQAELETLLATKPGDEAAIKKLVVEISTLRGNLYEQTTLFRLRFAKETGTPIRLTREMGRMGGHGPMMGLDMCQGKDGGKMMGMGKMMMDMQKGPMMDMQKGQMTDMDQTMPMPAAPAAAAGAATAPADKQ